MMFWSMEEMIKGRERFSDYWWLKSKDSLWPKGPRLGHNAGEIQFLRSVLQRRRESGESLETRAKLQPRQ
jgi:hypothetical protein